MISIVIPTYNEASSIQETLRRAASALRSTGESFELVVVDDSSADGTAEKAASLAGELPVRVVRRPGRLGLATAVLDGWASARGAVLGVMDADLQHPPEALSALVRALREEGADLAIASRYVPGGGSSDWTWVRRATSRTATHMAATVLPLALAAVRDPMSGMFLVRAAALEGVRLNPLGYKILLEVLAKARYRKLLEVPYIFEERARGSSKLGARQYLEYLLHLARLATATGQLLGWAKYGMVGLSGALVDLALFYFLVKRTGWAPAAALVTAIQGALLSNFLWNETFTFRAAQAAPARRSILRRFGRYERICLPGAILNALVTLVLLSQGAGLLVSAASGVVAGGVLNFLFNIPAIWRTWAS
jgi:dolichol-phosphate mannosyltransferase